HIYTLQQKRRNDAGSYVGFEGLGAKVSDCSVPALKLEIKGCDKLPYKFSANPTRDGRGFTAEARTLIGERHGLLPGCDVPDVWTINETGELRHVIDADEKC